MGGFRTEKEEEKGRGGGRGGGRRRAPEEEEKEECGGRGCGGGRSCADEEKEKSQGLKAVTKFWTCSFCELRDIMCTGMAMFVGAGGVDVLGSKKHRFSVTGFWPPG